MAALRTHFCYHLRDSEVRKKSRAIFKNLHQQAFKGRKKVGDAVFGKQVTNLISNATRIGGSKVW